MRTTRSWLAWLLVAVALPLLAAHAAGPTIQVSDAWARATSAPGQPGVVYFTLLDQGAPDALVGVSTPVAGMAMMHLSFVEQGVSRMRMQSSVPLQPGKPAVFRPGGLHVMLTELHAPLRQGASFPLTFRFLRAAPVTVTVPVLAAGAAGPGATGMPGMRMP